MLLFCPVPPTAGVYRACVSEYAFRITVATLPYARRGAGVFGWVGRARLFYGAGNGGRLCLKRALALCSSVKREAVRKRSDRRCLRNKKVAL